MELWLPIQEFPDYLISNEGRVKQAEKGNLLTISVNQFGIAHVGLTKNGVQCRRGLAHLVAKTFLRNPNHHIDTPINLNGDRLDCRAENLAWRSRWFAIEFFKQLNMYKAPVVEERVRSITTGEEFDNSREAALHYGLIEWQIFDSIRTGSYVPPVNLIFDYA